MTRMVLRTLMSMRHAPTMSWITHISTSTSSNYFRSSMESGSTTSHSSPAKCPRPNGGVVAQIVGSPEPKAKKQKQPKVKAEGKGLTKYENRLYLGDVGI